MNKTYLKYYCKICKKEICSKNAVYGSGLCGSCSQTGSKNHQHIDGRKNKQHFCSCGNKISYTTFLIKGKCRTCMGKSYSLPTVDYYCKDCGKKIHTCTGTYTALRCKSCARIEQWKLHPETNPMFGRFGELSYVWKGGKEAIKIFCTDCGKELHWSAIYQGSKRCSSCAFKGENNPMFGKLPTHGKRQYYKDICFRSSWEVKYAKYLDFNNIKWSYESKTFDLGNTTYTPDFYLPETDEYIEIKGWWSDKFDIKLKKFTSLYSNINLTVYEEGALTLLGILDESYLFSPSVVFPI